MDAVLRVSLFTNIKVMNGGFIFVSKVSHSGPSTDNKQNLKTKTYIDIVFFPEYLVSILFSYSLY